MCVLSRSVVTPWTVAHQAPLFMEFFQARILKWVAISSSRGIFPTQGSNKSLASTALEGRFITVCATLEDQDVYTSN